MTQTYLLRIFFIIQKILHQIVNNRNLISVQNNYLHIHKNMVLDNNILIFAISENMLKKSITSKKRNTFPNIMFNQLSFIDKLNIYHSQSSIYSLLFFCHNLYTNFWF